MKIGFALIRKEADLYRSQGLHREALGLYAKYIARSANIDPATKSSIKKQIQVIESEMNCGDTKATRELSVDGSNLTEKSWGASSTDTKTPKVLIGQGSPERKRFHRDHALKSFLKSIVAFVLVGSIFFYFVDWFSEVARDKSGEVVQKTVTMVIKKMPTLVGNEHLLTLPDNGMEDQSAMLSKEKAVIGDTQPAFDPVETQEAARNLASSTNDDKIADGAPGDDFQIDGTSYSETPAVENTDARTSPEEPDPASVIDYVLKKRGP